MRKLRDISKNEQFNDIVSILFNFEIKQSSKNSRRMLEIDETIQIVINATIQTILTAMMQIMLTLFSNSSRSQKPQRLQKLSEKINNNEKTVK